MHTSTSERRGTMRLDYSALAQAAFARSGLPLGTLAHWVAAKESVLPARAGVFSYEGPTHRLGFAQGVVEHLERFLFVPPTPVAYVVMRQFGRRPWTCAAGLVLAGRVKHCVSKEMFRECRTVDEVHAIAALLGLEVDFQFRPKPIPDSHAAQPVHVIDIGHAHRGLAHAGRATRPMH